jgi:hypothetical protein
MLRGNKRKVGAKPRKPTIKLKHLQFILEYLKNGNNGAQAYGTVFNSNDKKKNADNANSLLQKPLIKEYIAKIMGEAVKTSGISAEYILNSLKEVADACKKKRVEQDENGNLIEKGVQDSAGACRSLELLGKNLRLWTESMDVHLKKDFDNVSDEELLEIIKNSKKQENDTNNA